MDLVNEGEPVYSVVIPMKNEAENAPSLVVELDVAMERVGEPWELICVDDGSTDQTGQVLAELQRERPYMRILTMRQNRGQSAAFDAGFYHARGHYVITLDGDGQNDPADIPQFHKLREQFDLICGIRTVRRDSPIKRLISRLANSVRSYCCRDGVVDTGCSLKLYRRSCLKRIKMYKGMHRFLPALFAIEGFRVGQIPVNHRERLRGKSHYSFANRSLNTVFDLFAVMWMRSRHIEYEVKEK